MPRDRILTIVLAGGAGSRLDPLTDGRAKPAVPFGGTYRLIDFPLSNCLHSDVSDVWVIQQTHPESLTDHLSNGRPWDLDRTYGGLLVLHPRVGEKGGFHQGTADALWRNSDLVRELDPARVVVVSADAPYRLDYRSLADADADLVMVTTEVEPSDAGRYGVVQVSGDTVTDYAYKPDEPAGNLVANEVFVFRTGALLDTLDAAVRDLGEAAVEDGELADLGDTVLPRLVEGGSVAAHRMDGYWRDVGTLDSYWEGHLDLLGESPALDLEGWDVRTHGAHRAPARLLPSSSVEDSLVSYGAVVSGTVTRSVLGPGVRVEAGATVTDSVLLGNTVVRSGAVVRRAVLDERTTVGSGARVGTDAGLTVTRRGTAVDDDAVLEPEEKS